MFPDLPYTIVVATRNRPEALRLSLPRMLEQSCPPQQIVIIDASDDHARIVTAVQEAIGPRKAEVTLVPGARGLTRQRNLGLTFVRHPIVFFPDDDSIWFPDTAEKILRVYASDTEGRIAAVCAAESSVPPPEFPVNRTGTYRMRPLDRLKQRFGRWRAAFERKLVPDPAQVLGRSFWPRFQSAPWAAEQDVIPVAWMTGFRMSFRTEVIRRIGFNETMTDYCLFEDIDASFAAWQRGSVVAARGARVFHYRSPERRGDGWRMGVEQLLNKAYVIVRYSPPGHPARRSVLPFACYKTLQYVLGLYNEFGRRRMRGAVATIKALPALLRSSPGEADAAYAEAGKRIARVAG